MRRGRWLHCLEGVERRRLEPDIGHFIRRLGIVIIGAAAALSCTCRKPAEAAQASPAPVAAAPTVKPADAAPAEPEDAALETGGDDAPWPALPEGKSSRAEPLKVETVGDTSCRSWAAYTIDTSTIGEVGDASRIRVFEGQPKGECGARTSSPVLEVQPDSESCEPQLLLPSFVLLDCGAGTQRTNYIYNIADGGPVFRESCDNTVVGVDWFDCVSGLESDHECADNRGASVQEGRFQPALVRHFDARTGEVTRIEPRACMYIE